MRFIEEFLAGSIILIGKGTGLLLVWASTLLLLAAGISLLARIIYWLRFGDWIASICDGHIRFLSHFHTLLGSDQPFLCVNPDTGWTGVDRLIGWILLRGDMSLALLTLGLALLGIAIIAVVLIFSCVPKGNWIRKYYESR